LSVPDSNHILPPAFSTYRFTIDSPRPVPDDFVVKFGVNIFSRIVSGIPEPLSETATTTLSSLFSILTLITPSLPCGIDWIPFLIRFERILFICSLSE
jgi:hypothetical protein